MALQPFTDADRDRLRELHARGLARNDIAREMGRSGATISKYAEELGLTFDRETVKAATAARQADNRAKRADLESLMLDDALKLRAQLWQPHEYIDHGGKEFVEVRWIQEEPSPVDKLKLMQAAGIAADRSLKLAVHDADTGVDAARSMLADLFDALGREFRGDKTADA